MPCAALTQPLMTSARSRPYQQQGIASPSCLPVPQGNPYLEEMKATAKYIAKRGKGILARWAGFGHVGGAAVHSVVVALET